ncbi:MAG: 6-phosphofructokinase [Candidatus Hydrogenedentes bacterium]|nr:6-phosphofructokinase [Candidatus Hydrogenedentota bacterium]
MPTSQGKVLIAQGGGPTAVINQSLVGAVLEARRFTKVTRVYGALHGVRGIINEEFVDLSEATNHNLESVAQTPASGLLSTRDKPDVNYCREIFKVLKAHDIRYFFYIGGNDSADTCRIVSEESQTEGYDLRVIHIPKTIDNDLKVTDHCPGFGSAAKFVAQAFIGADLDNRALPGVYIAVLMGRHAGFLTASSALARTYPDDGPHLIYVPERPITREKLLADIASVYERLGRCIVAVSEGVADPNGNLLVESDEKDAHGNVQLSGTGALGDRLSSWVKAGTGIKRVRADTLGYLQRSFLGCVSEVDQREAREVGEKAAHYAIRHGLSGSVAIRRIGNYAADYILAPLSAVAREAVAMPDHFLHPNGNDVTPAFIEYVRPLVGTLPTVTRIVAPPVVKILNKEAQK